MYMVLALFQINVFHICKLEFFSRFWHCSFLSIYTGCALFIQLYSYIVLVWGIQMHPCFIHRHSATLYIQCTYIEHLHEDIWYQENYLLTKWHNFWLSNVFNNLFYSQGSKNAQAVHAQGFNLYQCCHLILLKHNVNILNICLKNGDALKLFFFSFAKWQRFKHGFFSLSASSNKSLSMKLTVQRY